MEKRDDPSELEKILRDYEKPPLREQFPYLVGFRDFIHDPANKSHRGRTWNAPAVLDKLWELWHERANEKGLRAQFAGKYGQRIERFVRHEKGEARADTFLLTLIKRFLHAYGIKVPSPEIIESLRNSARELSAILPRSRRIPFFDRQVPKLVTRLYQIRKEPNEGNRVEEQVEDFYYLALQLSSRATPCCLALIFTPSRLDLDVGLYFFATRECYMRRPDTTGYLRYTLSPWQGHEAPLPKPDDAWRNRAFAAENYHLDKPGQGPLRDTFIEYYCSFEVSNDAEALRFAEKYLRHFNFDM